MATSQTVSKVKGVSLQWPNDDAYRPHIDLCWLGVLAAWIGPASRGIAVHRRFYVVAR